MSKPQPLPSLDYERPVAFDGAQSTSPVSPNTPELKIVAEAPRPDPQPPTPVTALQPPQNDPLGVLKNMSEEEIIALFT